MQQTALVLGSNGMIGRRLAPMLESRGVDVRSASRSATGSSHFDWHDKATYGPALEGNRAVYLVVADPGAEPDATVLPFLEEARLAGVGKIVAVSSLGVTISGEPDTSPRLRLEQLIAQSGLDWTILRPGGFNQNFSESFLLPGIMRAGMVATATGSGPVAFVDAEDIAAVAAVALTESGHEGQHYSLTGPEALTFAQATAVIAEAAGRPIAYQALSETQFAGILAGAGIPPHAIAIMVRDQLAISRDEATVVSATVPELTGRKARTFADFAKAAAAVWRA
ncbi:NAD(P)H-binding protein [Devosia sp. ZW T5_3]|uniref:NAD(P)H-binding protein n=1 Tax=Devosia sp. ZW T5_3 TaxID=3378085 RepID=UPI0038536DD0